MNVKYLCAFFVLFAIEAAIAVFAKDNFIRDHLGDVLIVVLIYCFIKSFVSSEIKLLWLYIFAFAALVEVGQYFHLVDLLGLGEYKLARIVFGTTFDMGDIVCYFAGCLGIYLFEIAKRRFSKGGI